MPRGGANFSSEELVRVLSHYDIGIVHRVKPLTAGNRRAPKVIVTADKGIFLLKRRPRGRDDLQRVAFAHAVQQHLAGRAFPVTSLLATTDGRTTVLSLENHIYEFFQFVTGARYDGSAEATREAGRQLAIFHQHLADFDLSRIEGMGLPNTKQIVGDVVAPSNRGQEVRDAAASSLCFHDSALVRRHLGMIGADRRAETGRRLLAVAGELLLRYDKSSARVNELHFRAWKRQIVHGDWHPGNLLFSDHKIVAVVDFDSIRVAPPATDLANGMLQFSIVGDRPNPAQWPAHFDRDRIFQFLDGYREIVRLSERKRYGLVDLMIESMIAEAVLPVAATGSFGQHSGLDFLEMILRKTKWLRRHRHALCEAMLT
jgi:Ser/Thr protein kinase RdoA (MazF antagonist)